MKLVYALFFLAVGITVATAQTRLDLKMEVDSAQRRYIVSVPTGPAPAGGYPLVFVFHPTAHNGATMYNTSKWVELGEAEKVLTVFPTALEYCMIDNGVQAQQTKWHNGEAEDKACPGQYLKDDTHFVQHMLDTLKSMYSINSRRIYATGFSNGAGFTAKLGIQMCDVFSAIASSGALLDEGDSTRPARNVPAWFVLGTEDELWLDVYKSLGLTEFPFNDSTLDLVSPVLKRWLACENLTWDHSKTPSGITLNYVFNTPASPESAYEFRYTLIKGMGHAYPNGINVPIIAANVFWAFFNQYQMPVSVESAQIPSDITRIYPNPAHEFVIVSGDGEVILSLKDMLGQEVFRGQGTGGVPLNLPRLIAGMYLAEVTSGREHKFCTILLQ